MIIGEITDLTQVSIGNELIEEALKWVAEHHKDPFENGSILNVLFCPKFLLRAQKLPLLPF